MNIKLALLVLFFGLFSFITAIIAERKKPPFGTSIVRKDTVICKFPTNSTVSLGALSLVAHALTVVVGHAAIWFPYKGQPVTWRFLFQSAILRVFFLVAESVSVFGFGLLLWVTITEGLHRSRSVHRDLGYQCPTAKTGLFGGAAFVALDAALLWLICQLLTINHRADYLEEDAKEEEDGQVHPAATEESESEHVLE